ncbi:hypothetical protein GCM10029978_070170 [Actinoallomurus acanthiterrae]
MPMGIGRFSGGGDLGEDGFRLAGVLRGLASGSAGHLRCPPGPEAVALALLGAAWQCRRTHYLQNLLTKVRKSA